MSISTGNYYSFYFGGNYAPLELKNLAKMKYTTETVCQHNSSCIRLLPIFDYDFLSNCNSLMHGIGIHFVQHFQAILQIQHKTLSNQSIKQCWSVNFMTPRIRVVVLALGVVILVIKWKCFISLKFLLLSWAQGRLIGLWPVKNLINH